MALGSRIMNRRTPYQLVAATVLLLLRRELLALAQQHNLSELLPPLGNSVSLVTISRDASRTYSCLDGKWELIRSFATLVDASNFSAVWGNYTYSYNETSSDITGHWAILNSVGDRSESGLQYILISGKVVSFIDDKDSNNLDNQLVEIDNRNTVTVAGSFSYVLANGTGGAAPPGPCTASQTALVSFVASYTFYSQDVVPSPATLSYGVAVSAKERPLQSLFCTGYTNWTMQADRVWHFRSGIASLTDIPGGPLLGFLTISPGYSMTWTLADPYGWTVAATSVRTAPVGTRDWPWQLYAVQSFRGTSLLGKRTFVNFISTRGGLPPPSTGAEEAGATISQQFSAICWFFTTMDGVSS